MTTGLAGEKTCSRCGEVKPAGSFRQWRAVCKACSTIQQRERYQKDRAAGAARARAYREANRDQHNAYQRSYREANPERHFRWVQTKQLAYMGLTIKQFGDMLAAQDGRCAVCRRDSPGGKGRWHVDHDHRCCGRKRACPTCIRGLLCFNCNIAFGYLGDDPALLLAGADYLMRFRRDDG